MFILLVLYEMHVKTPSMECQKVIRSELPGAFSVACTRCTRRGAGAVRAAPSGGVCEVMKREVCHRRGIEKQQRSLEKTIG